MPNEEWAAATGSLDARADRELCISTFSGALSLLALDVDGGLRWTAESVHAVAQRASRGQKAWR